MGRSNFTQRCREAESAERELLKREVYERVAEERFMRVLLKREISERVLKKEKKLSENELRERIFGK